MICSSSTQRHGTLLLMAVRLLCFVLQSTKVYPQTPYSFELVVPKKLATKEDGATESTVSYEISVDGETYILKLVENRGLISKDFAAFSYNEKGTLITESIQFDDNCYYQGTVEGVIGSIVALSICSGLRGFLQIKTVNYRIEPVPMSSTFQHLIFKAGDIDHEREPCFPIRPNKTSKSKPAMHSVFSDGRYAKFIETYIVVDKAVYLAYQSNNSMVTHKVLEVINLADAMFVPLHSHIVLVGLEIWSKDNLFTYLNTSKLMLHGFSAWIKNDFRTRTNFDIAYLFTGNARFEEKAHAFLGTVCDTAGLATGLVVLHTQHSVVDIAITFAHSVGHSTGMGHEHAENCKCSSKYCIMGLYTPRNVEWSECSISEFEHFLARGRGKCLYNVPPVESFFTMTFCGNNLVEDGEQCDCGTPGNCAKDPCCETTCQLKSGAECAYGECCKWCRLVDAGIPCRKPDTECDLAEYCSGTSSICPPDVFSQDGTPCNNYQSYCINKKCYDYGRHCRLLFGKEATVAEPECFLKVNIHGRHFGNCGFDSKSKLKKCETSNAMCGRVQCDNVNKNLVYPQNIVIHQIPVGNRWCWTLSNDYDNGLQDIGAVDDGAQCGSDKVCLNRTCLPSSVLKSGCDEKKNCSRHGLCNNKNNCHCNKDWAPPDCKYKGFGGSIDSGPLIEGSYISYVPNENDRMYFAPAHASTLVTEKTQYNELFLLLILMLYF